MTLTSFPGAFFLVSAAITVPVLLIFAWFYWQVRKEQNDELKSSLTISNSTLGLDGDGGEDGRGGGGVGNGGGLIDDVDLEDGGDSGSDSEQSSSESVSSTSRSPHDDKERY